MESKPANDILLRWPIVTLDWTEAAVLSAANKQDILMRQSGSMQKKTGMKAMGN